MNTTQLPFLVEGILIIATMIFGALLGRAATPYGKVKLVIHLFLFTWFTVGFFFIVSVLATTNVSSITWVPVALMGLTILVQAIFGIVMLASKKRVQTFQMIHIASAILMLLSDVWAFVLMGNRS